MPDERDRTNEQVDRTGGNDPYAAAKSRIADAYSTYLGRNGSDDEYNTHLYSQYGQNYLTPGFVEQQVGYIANSPEAQAYKTAQSQKPPATDQTQKQPPPPSGSPVTANGGIPPAQGLQPAPSAPASRPNELRYVQPVDLSSVPAYKPYQFSTGNVSPYTAPTTSLPPVNFDQFIAPDQSGVNNGQNALVSAILANPDTMNPAVVAQQKEAAKESALLMARQGQQTADAGNVARGTLGSGAASADARQRIADTINAILTSNRNTDVNAAQINRQNELDALTGSEGVAQGQLGRATSAYGARLGGQQAQATSALQRAVAGEQFKQAAADSGLNVANFNLGREEAQAGENYKASSDAVQRLLSQFGINTGVANNAASNYATDISRVFGSNAQLLDYLRYLESQREFNDTLGFNYTSLNNNTFNGLLG